MLATNKKMVLSHCHFKNELQVVYLLPLSLLTVFVPCKNEKLTGIVRVTHGVRTKSTFPTGNQTKAVRQSDKMETGQQSYFLKQLLSTRRAEMEMCNDISLVQDWRFNPTEHLHKDRRQDRTSHRKPEGMRW